MRRVNGVAVAALLMAPAFAWAEKKTIVFITTELTSAGFVTLSTQVVTSELPPRLDTGSDLRLVSLDSQRKVLAIQERRDPRVMYVEGNLPAQTPLGTHLHFSVELSPGLRRVEWVESGGQSPLLSQDLGPTLVDGCRSGAIATSLCETFDSDGDGCRDVVDPEPLVVEKEPPAIQLAVSPTRLYPPDHRLVLIGATVSAKDNCTSPPTVVLRSVTSSDPESGMNAGDIGPDVVGAELSTLDTQFQLRAERFPPKSTKPRVYTIVYEAKDLAGNIGRGTATVTVPHAP